MANIYDIFISYRRDSGAQYARILQLMLTQRGYKVFLDYDELTDGKFGDHIQQAIKSAPIFILVLSRESLVRCKAQGDWVRREIQLAIAEGKHIIPINPDNTFDGVPSDIPEDIKTEVSSHQYSEINFGQTLGVTVDFMIENRIVPQIGSRTHRDNTIDNDIEVLNRRLAAEDKALRRHRSFIKTLVAVGIVSVCATVGYVAYKFWQSNNIDQKRRHLIEQVEKHHQGLNLMANDSITIEQLEVLDHILDNMRAVYGDTIMFSAYETTVREYYTILGERYDKSQALMPVTDISFSQAITFITRLNELINSNETGLAFTLPTEAEWEYAASDAVSQGATPYAGSNDINQVAWYSDNAGGSLHQEDGQNQLKPNKFGLFDMSGNVSEYVFEPYIDPANPETPTNMMITKGGNYMSDKEACKIKHRVPIESDLSSPRVGFRLTLRRDL